MSGPKQVPKVVLFANRVTRPEDPNECIEWPGAVMENGYGVFAGTTAHRATYEIFVGDLPADSRRYVVDHLCRNPRCVNPFHLELTTNQENTLRGRKGRLLTHCHNGHEFTDENTIVERDGHRRCRVCKAAKQARAAKRFIEGERRTCVDCGKAISRYSARCLSCSAFERELRKPR